MPTINIKVDFREGNSGIPEILSNNYSTNVTIEALPVGDYIIEDFVVFERKTHQDFIVSLMDGRLFAQASRMKRNFQRCSIILEGLDLYNTSIDVHPNAIKGALVDLTVIWQVPILYSKTPEDTAFHLWLSGQQYVEADNNLLKRYGYKPKKEANRKLYILQGLPKVGPKLAKALLEYFGSVEKVITSSEEELSEIRGIGRKRAKIIKEVLA